MSGLKRQNETQIEKNRMPWGYFVQHVLEQRYQVKEICLREKGACFSYHFHRYVDEIWYVKEGYVHAILGESEKDFLQGAIIRIPRESTHRLYNAGDPPAIIIEIQVGTILFDDVCRLQDNYGREDTKLESPLTKSYCLEEFELQKVKDKKCKSNTSNFGGTFSTFLDLEDYRIRMISMNAKARCTYHYHQFVDEIWIVLEGKIMTYIGGVTRNYQQGEVIHIPRNTQHYYDNIHDGTTKIIEIQIGRNPVLLNDIVWLKKRNKRSRRNEK